MNISHIYKVDDLEFNTKAEAETYMKQKEEQQKKDIEYQKIVEEDINAIKEQEETLYSMYKSFELKHMYLPNRSNNIKELLKIYLDN